MVSKAASVADAWNILRQFVEPGLQALDDQKGTAEVWASMRLVEAHLGLAPKLPRPKGAAVVKQEVVVKAEKTKTVKQKIVTKKQTARKVAKRKK